MARKLFILFSLVVFCHCLLAQTTLQEATLTYDIQVMAPNDASAKKLLDGSALRVYIKGEKTRTDVISSLGMETAIYNNRTNVGAILKEYSGQKIIIHLNKEHWTDKSKLFRGLQFSMTNETKQINGFQCKKAFTTLEDGDRLEVYYTSDVLLANKDYNNSFYALPGTPVQYEIKSGSMVFKYILKRIDYDLVPFSTFDIPKQGYRVLQYEDAAQLRKGM